VSAPEIGRSGPIAAGTIALAIAAAYVRAYDGPFQFDDWNVIVRDPRVASLGAWWDSMPGIRPILKLSYALNNASGLGAPGFHAVNVAIHAGCALLVLAILSRLARSLGAARKEAPFAALAGALLFALHPVQTEAVTYISGRSTSLCALFALASVLSWLDGRATGRVWLVYGLSPALFALALGVKEIAAALPLALLLVCACEGRSRPREVLASLAGHGPVLAACAAAALSSTTYRHLLATSLGARSIGENLLTQAGAVVYLAGQLVRLDRLNIDPALPVAKTWTVTGGVSVALLAAAIAVGLVALRSRPATAFGVLWFFIWLAPTNSILPRLDVANDRQLYIAIAGPAWLAGWGAARLVRKAPSRRRAVQAALAAACLGLLAATATRTAVYEDEIRLWEDTARKSPDKARAYNNLGYAYALAGRGEEAEAAFTYALALDPAHVKAAVNLKLLRAGNLLPR